MPVILRIDGLLVVIYPNDHRPAHVHVFAGGNEAMFYLNCPDGPLTLRDNHGFNRKELGRIGDKLTPHVTELCAAWKEFHGNYEG